MPNRTWEDDPTIPPPGRRTGNGSGSILPYLVRSLAAKPRNGMEPEAEPKRAAAAQQQSLSETDRPS